MQCQQRLEQYLRAHQVAYEVEQHRTAFTAQEVAQVEHIPGNTVAKVVVAHADKRLIMFVLPATSMLDYERAARIAGSTTVHLANEGELRAVFPDCELGAMPPFGNLYDTPVYVDKQLTDDEFITFAAGTHTTTIKLRYADYQRLVSPVVGDLGRLRPAFSA